MYLCVYIRAYMFVFPSWVESIVYVNLHSYVD